MSFFGKLKDRLFKSSSRIEEELDAVVREGGGEEPAVARPPETEPPRRDPEPGPQPTEPDIEPGEVPDPGPDVVPDPTPRPTEPDIEPRRPPFGVPLREPEPGPDLPPTEVPPEPDYPDYQPDLPPTEIPPQPTMRPAARVVQPALEDGDLAVAERPGLLGRLFGRAAPVPRRVLDDAMLERLEEVMIGADMGVDTALRISANLAETHLGRRLTTAEVQALLSGEIARVLEPVARPMPLYPTKPQVVLVVGVNGSGKTTTIGKLASQFRAAGKRVVIAAGDTFRAAAVEQLQIWGERAGVPVMTAPEGSDPASLAFDALKRAKAEGADLLMIDTAGRLQNRADLMEELAKIVRVLRKQDPEAPHNTILVLDATTGQNALNQVDIFRKIAAVTGLVMTKLDGTAKGGVLVALADRFGLPIHAIGVGEAIDDLQPFDPEDFARALTGAAA